MANVKISELPSTTAVTGSDVVPIVQSGLTKQVSFSDFLASPTLFASGIASFLSTPSSANLRAALTDETGTGPAVFATSPTIDNPTVTGVVAVPDGTAAAPALTNTGDTNTGVFFPDADTVGVSTGGTERLRVDASGNVGVGTNSPGAPLDVVTTSSADGISLRGRSVDNVSNFSFKSNTAATTYGQIQGRSTDFRLQANSLPLTFYTGGAERMLLDTSGNLGLGVTPSAWGSSFKAIQVGSGAAFVGSNLTSQSLVLANAYSDAVGLKYINTAQASYYQQYLGAHQWYTAPSGTAGNAISFTQAMTLDASGNLGVGVTSPDVRLRLDAASPTRGVIQTVRGTGSTGSQIHLSQDGVSDWAFGQPAGENAFAFWSGRNRAADGTERARITSDGDLLVGTTTSEGRLNVYTSNFTSATNAFGVKSAVSGSGLLFVRSDGYVSMEYTYNFLTSAAAANMVIGSGGFIYRSTSSLKYKRDVADATHGLAEVMQLRPVTYKGKADSDGDKVFGGLIAEEVHAAGLNEFVSYNDKGEPDALHYGHMVSLLTKAIQEQQTIIQSLTARIEALEAQS